MSLNFLRSEAFRALGWRLNPGNFQYPPNSLLLLKFLFCLVFFLLSLVCVSGIILTARYFDKKRSRANALCLSGTAAGSFTLPMLIQHLFRHTLSQCCQLFTRFFCRKMQPPRK